MVLNGPLCGALDGCALSFAGAGPPVCFDGDVLGSAVGMAAEMQPPVALPAGAGIPALSKGKVKAQFLVVPVMPAPCQAVWHFSFPALRISVSMAVAIPAFVAFPSFVAFSSSFAGLAASVAVAAPRFLFEVGDVVVLLVQLLLGTFESFLQLNFSLALSVGRRVGGASLSSWGGPRSRIVRRA